MEGKERHESYGMLQFVRSSQSVPQALFGSSLQHQNTIRMCVRQGEAERSLGRDLYFGDNLILEVEMSYSQFAEAITTMNMGTGVPVTLRYIEGRGRMEPCPFTSKRECFEGELKENLAKANEKANELIKKAEELLTKTSLTKRDRAELQSALTSLHAEINGNREYIYKQFNEQMDKTVVEAKGEIEAFVQNKSDVVMAAALAGTNGAVWSNGKPVIDHKLLDGAINPVDLGEGN